MPRLSSSTKSKQNVEGSSSYEMQKGRSLRSNTKSNVQKDVRPPPAEFVDKYFYKDFGVHGVFVGVCVSLCIHGHKNGRDDIYSVQYDDGDVEALPFRDVRKLLKRAGADHEAYLNAANKRKEALEALKKSEPAKHKQNQETAKRSTKIASDNAASAKQAKATAKSNVSDKSEKQSAADKTEKADKPEKNGKTDKPTETTKGTPKTPPKSPDKKPKRVSVPRRRKAKTKIEDEEEEKKVPKLDFNQPGFGWLNHQPTAITKITKRRYREVREYGVQWTNTGDTVSWEPAQNIHAKLVNDFERTYEEEVPKATVKPPVKMTKQQKLSNAAGLKAAASATAAALNPTYTPLTPAYIPTTTPTLYVPPKTPMYVPPTTSTSTPMTSLGTTTPTYSPLNPLGKPIAKPMLSSSSSTSSTTLSSSVASSSSYTPYKPTYTTSKPLSTTMKSTNSPTKFGSTTKTSTFPPSFVNPLHTATRIGVPLTMPQTPLLQSTPTLAHLELEKRHMAVLSSYRSVLQFIEPPGWAGACASVSSLTNDALERFPLVSFLEFYEHHFQEMLYERDVKLQQVETKLADAQQQSAALKKQLETLSKSGPH
eukprot:m.159191 g.159191  ORF g.159191 m.159191 type:complete len:594 (-) comp31125_c0_seq2:114-1895(-)